MMQYLLSEEEYEDMTHQGRTAKNAVLSDMLELCTLVCDHMIPLHEDVPHGCIKTHPSQAYCGGCPVEQQCPYESKRFSK